MKNLEQIELFSRSIIDLVNRDNLTYTEAVVEFCEINQIEIETGAKLLSQSIIASISQEARQNNLLEKISVLPI